MKVLASKWIRLRNLKASRFVVQFVERKKSVVTDNIIALHKGVKYELILRTLANRYQSDEKEFEKVIASWRLTPRM